MIDLRVDKEMLRIRECEGNTAELIYELTLIAGSIVKMARENNKPKMADLILQWIKTEEFAKMVESMAGETLGVRRVKKTADSSAAWNLIQNLIKEKNKCY